MSGSASNSGRVRRDCDPDGVRDRDLDRDRDRARARARACSRSPVEAVCDERSKVAIYGLV